MRCSAALVIRPRPVPAGSSQQPISQLPHGRVEGDEHGAADQGAVQPDAVEAAYVAGGQVGVPLEGGPRRLQIRTPGRPRHPRIHGLASPVHVGEELFGLPGLQGTELGVFIQRDGEHPRHCSRALGRLLPD